MVFTKPWPNDLWLTRALSGRSLGQQPQLCPSALHSKLTSSFFGGAVAYLTRFFFPSAALTLALVALVGCGGSGAASSDKKSPAILTSITIAPSSVALNVGAAQQLTVDGAYSDGTHADVTSLAAWATSNAAIMTVNAGGLLNAIASGTATVTATVSTSSATAPVTINPPAKTLTSINITPNQLSIPQGTQQQLGATGHYSDNSQADLTTTVTWNSSNGNVATFSATGDLIATGMGAASGDHHCCR